jgi:hypothetical protein
MSTSGVLSDLAVKFRVWPEMDTLRYRLSRPNASYTFTKKYI